MALQVLHFPFRHSDFLVSLLVAWQHHKMTKRYAKYTSLIGSSVILLNIDLLL